MTVEIQRVEAWSFALPMRWPLKIGPITYNTRDYAVVRLTSTEGIQGIATGYTRGTPVLDSLSVLLSDLTALTGTPPEVQRRLRMRYATGWGAFIRAASLIDIALWDVRARTEGVSLAHLLGPHVPEPKLMVVAGYFADQRTRGEILDEIGRFVVDGFSTMKLIIGGKDAKADLEYASQVKTLVGDQIDVAIDLHGAYLRAVDALEYVKAFHGSGIRFLEDPLPSIEIDEIAELAQIAEVPIAAGEDIVASSTYASLVKAGVGVLRVDATATGGYTGALEGVAAAEVGAVDIYPHVWPYIHAPLAAASFGVRAVEVIPHYVHADPLMEFVTEPLPIRDGRWRVPSVVGLHLPLDWTRLLAEAERTEVFDRSTQPERSRRDLSMSTAPRALSPTTRMLITGAASGLGAAVAELCIASGGEAVLLDQSESELARLVDDLSSRGRVMGVTADIRKDTDVQRSVDQVESHFDGHLTCLVNCAGIARPAPASEEEMSSWIELVDIHLLGTMRMCQAAFPLLRATDGASIVNVSSVAAVLGMPGRSSYSAAKAGIEGLTRTLAVEWAEDGIRVNAVAPGYIDSKMTASLVQSGRMKLEPILSRTPLHRLVSPWELAESVLFLASPQAAYITGHVLRVDGGMSIEGNWYRD